ncbi:MAG: dienelactone hydrolase family protein [Tepidisphaerales bacterium]
MKTPAHRAFVMFTLIFACVCGGAEPPATLPGSDALQMQGDIASELVTGVDRFLMRELDRSVVARAVYWKRDFSSPEAYERSIAPNRERLRQIIGVRDARVSFAGPQVVALAGRNPVLARGVGYEVYAVRWSVLDGVNAEGLLLQPVGRERIADVVAIPDADLTPEQIAGLADGVEPASQYARRLAEAGCRVLVPTLIDRTIKPRRPPGRTEGGVELTSREFLYRPAFELGRHPIGYEVQKVLAAVDFFSRQAAGRPARIGVAGWGEGGLLSLYAAACDTRITAACVSGSFARREQLWREPIDRNIFGLLQQFGDAELASLVAPRALVIEACRGPEKKIAGKGGAPGELATPALEEVRHEVERAKALVAELRPAVRMELVVSGEGKGPMLADGTLAAFLNALSPGAKLAANGARPEIVGDLPDPAERQTRQIVEIDRHTQRLLTESPSVRREFMKRLDTSSLEKYEKSAQEYRKIFYEQMIGKFDQPMLPPRPRTRLAMQSEKWVGYEVVLDVFPDVIAYGLLLLPRDLKEGERRPVVVCQHGLEGRPQFLIGQEGNAAYKAYAARLAERGFIVFAPQNLYLFGDRFRVLQRKANPLGKTLFSIITPQHRQILDWLKTLPNVDPARIGFYGLSYGGKTAMRVPAILTDYRFSICSADFNDWVWKNASTLSPYSYVYTGEYEIFEFDLGSTFNYAEMAALIAPRPFMVERGHFDGVAPDETVAAEFAKVRLLYNGRLGIGDRCEIEFFAGPHTINGIGTFDFVHRNLGWPKR